MHTIPETDGAVVRWERLKERFPEAGRWFDEGFHYGFLRHADPIVRESSLARLIDALLNRETAQGHGKPGLRPGRHPGAR